MYTVLNTIKSQGFNKLQLQKLAKNESFEILSITLEKGAVFPTHTSPMEALLIVIEGYHLRNQQHFSFPKEIEHWVNANENSKFIIVR